MPQRRALSNGAGVINGIVYVPGGQGTNGVYTNSLYAYNPATNSWTSKAVMPVASGCGGSGAIGGKLYVYTMCHANGSIQGGLYVYNPGTNSWGGRISAPFMKYPAVGVVNGKLYLVGGLDSSGTVTTNAAFAYEPATGQLTSLPPMSVRRSAPTAVGLNGLLYVIGGMSATGETAATVEVYNPATNSWRTVAEMPTARWLLGAGVIGGKLYAVGGNAGATLPTNQIYTP
jgi:N-acetylneuraminic acid mutarotase